MIAVRQNNITTNIVNALLDPDNALEIVIAPKNKKELANIFREMEERPEKYAMDLRVSASINKLNNSVVSDEQRIDFIREINFKQESFKQKMQNLKEREKLR